MIDRTIFSRAVQPSLCPAIEISHPQVWLYKQLLDRIGDVPMLETPQERVRLLKAGIDGKTIEKLYIIFNNFKIVNVSLLFELVEINIEENQNSAIEVKKGEL